jgi:hypothetical protein
MSLSNIPTLDTNFETKERFLDVYHDPIRSALALLPCVGERLADDVTNSLFLKIWEKDILSKKPDEKGRFRGWLYVVALHHAKDEAKKRWRRHDQSPLLEAEEPADRREADADDEPFDSDEYYALSVLHMTVARVRKRLIEDGMAEHWMIFEELHLAPIIPGRLAKTRDQLLAMFPAQTPGTLDNRATTVKRIFKSMLPALIPVDPTDSLSPGARFQEFQEILRASKNTRLWLAFLSDPVPDPSESLGSSLDLAAPLVHEKTSEPDESPEVISDELRILLGFWLEKPLQDYLDDVEGVGAAVAAAARAASHDRRRGPLPIGTPSLTLRTLIEDNSPLVSAIPPDELTELLKRLKSFVKRVHGTSQGHRAAGRLVPAYRWESSLPLEVAQVLYNLAGAIAFLRCRARIIGLDDNQYRKNITWVLSQPWLDARLRPLFFAVIMQLHENS